MYGCRSIYTRIYVIYISKPSVPAAAGAASAAAAAAVDAAAAAANFLHLLRHPSYPHFLAVPSPLRSYLQQLSKCQKLCVRERVRARTHNNMGWLS